MADRTTQQADAPVNVWHRPARDVRFGDFEFRIWVRRMAGKTRTEQVYGVDNVIQALSWTEQRDGLLVGSITVHNDETPKFEATVGDEVTCQWSHMGQNRWHTLWRMYLTRPQYQFSAEQTVFQLEDGIVRLQKSRGTFRFKADRAHPRGWRTDRAIRHVLKRYDVPVARLPRMKHRVKKLTMTNQSPLAVIARLLKDERSASGDRYFVRWVSGKFAVVPYTRSKYLLLMGGYIIDGTREQAQKDKFATVLEVVSTKDDASGKDRKGRKKRKKKRLRTVVRSEAGIRRFGVIRRTYKVSGADTVTELRRRGKRELARRARPKDDLSFTHPGIPTLRLGDAVRLSNRDAGLDRVIVYASEIAHTVQPGDYSMDVTVTFDDPYVDKRKGRVKKKRSGETEKPQPVKASQRS